MQKRRDALSWRSGKASSAAHEPIGFIARLRRRAQPRPDPPVRSGPDLDLTCRGEYSVKFSFSSEQEEFRSNLRRLLADRSPTKEVRRLMETDAGYERDGWGAVNN